MRERINKPRVFLSHSKKDIHFIQRVCDDLRRCQVEPWLDEYEIRHGQPWLDAIFEDGMPTCDAVIAYITDHSITSAVVRKEIDVGILQKLKDSRIAFLPYVSCSALRSDLRVDLQAIQTPEWNAENYSDILPRVVAEIWRSFLERTVAQATQAERVARLEAELRLSELEKQKAGSVFQQREVLDFEYIWGKLDRYEPVMFQHTQGKKDSLHEVNKYIFHIHLGSLLPRLSNASNYVYGHYDVFNLVNDIFVSLVPNKQSLPEDEEVQLVSWPDIGDELLRYGFVTRFHEGSQAHDESVIFRYFGRSPYVLLYTEKLERFKYWLAVEGKMPLETQWKFE